MSAGSEYADLTGGSAGLVLADRAGADGAGADGALADGALEDEGDDDGDRGAGPASGDPPQAARTRSSAPATPTTRTFMTTDSS